MSPFARAINILFAGLGGKESNPGFMYYMFVLKDDDNARIYRIPTRKRKPTPTTPLPTKGRFVSLTLHPKSKELCIAFCSYPEGSDGSQFFTHGALAYDNREIFKGANHVIDWIMNEVIPLADNEYATPDSENKVT